MAQSPVLDREKIQRVATTASQESRALQRQVRRTNAAFAELRETLAEYGIKLVVDDSDTEEA